MHHPLATATGCQALPQFWFRSEHISVQTCSSSLFLPQVFAPVPASHLETAMMKVTSPGKSPLVPPKVVLCCPLDRDLTISISQRQRWEGPRSPASGCRKTSGHGSRSGYSVRPAPGFPDSRRPAWPLRRRPPRRHRGGCRGARTPPRQPSASCRSQRPLGRGPLPRDRPFPAAPGAAGGHPGWQVGRDARGPARSRSRS
jgi:hypothetical protein